MTDTTTTTDADATTDGDQGDQKPQTFTQADVDKIVRDRLAQQAKNKFANYDEYKACLLYTSPSPRDRTRSRMPSSA